MTRLLHLGDLELALPLGTALGAWLLAAGAGRTALRWAGCFSAALLLVGASKVAHLGWCTDLAPLAFQAISGHATVAAALYPFAAWIVLARRGRATARIGLAGGLLLAAAVALLLVTSGEHSAAEAASGFLLGTAASLAGVTASVEPQRARLATAALWTLPVLLLAAWLMQSAHIGYWMIRLALTLSGSSHPCAWDDWQACGQEPVQAGRG